MKKDKICRRCKKFCYGTYCSDCIISNSNVTGSVGRMRNRKNKKND